MNPEIWKRVPSLPLFWASSWGRIKTEDYVHIMPHGGTCVRRISPTYGSRADGRMVVLFRRKTYKVHSLVCEAFHGKRPDGLKCLHIDENFRNNKPCNLKWGTQKENLNAPGFIAYCKSRTGDKNPFVKARGRK